MAAQLHEFVRNLVLCIPPIRRLFESRNALLREREDLLKKVGRFDPGVGDSPYFHYHACFDPIAIIHRHAVAGIQPTDEYFTSFVGVLINPKAFPSFLSDKAGKIDHLPIPANWHSDIAEWGAALRAVELAGSHFTVLELGCGWGTWINTTGAVARRLGKSVHLIGIEGDTDNIALARETCITNGFSCDEVTLLHGIAAASSGKALFPKQERPGEHWGLEPLFNVDADSYSKALSSGRYRELPMISLRDVAQQSPRIDLLHIDIQGGEANLVSECVEVLNEKIAYLVIGTHSREIEGQLFQTLLAAGWHLEIERPAILALDKKPMVRVDGVQGWRNPKFL